MLTIRNYQAQDKESCLLAFKTNVPTYFTDEEISDFSTFLERLGNASALNTSYFVVEWNQNVIGCGGFGDKDDCGIISLCWGLISENYHKKGFGKALLLHRLNALKSLYPGLPLVMDTTQHSYLFFEKYGFQTIKITENFYATGLHRYDMSWQESS
jgi:N-acetylglutamate synthase-like GNAT family acetyltransferase